MNAIRAVKKICTPVVIFPLVCILLKLLIPFFFPLSRIILYIALIAYFVYLIVFCFRRKYSLGQKVIAVLIFCCILIFSVLRFEAAIDKAFFRVFESSYTAVAEELAEELRMVEDTTWGSYKLKLPKSLLTRHGKEVLYIKEGDRLLIGFNTIHTFFDLLTYTYFPDPDSAELIGEIDSIKWLGEHWAYVHWF